MVLAAHPTSPMCKHRRKFCTETEMKAKTLAFISMLDLIRVGPNCLGSDRLTSCASSAPISDGRHALANFISRSEEPLQDGRLIRLAHSSLGPRKCNMLHWQL